MRTFPDLLLFLGIGLSYVGCSGQVTIAAFPADGGGTGSSSGSSGVTPPGDSGGASCAVNGANYPNGAQFPAGDGCNSCTCNDGFSECTIAYCRVTDGGPGKEADASPPVIAACAAPAGTVQAFSSVSEVYAAMIGLWQICPGGGAFFGAPADTIGIEYGQASSDTTAGGSTAGGPMYYLVQGPSGPVRGQGFNYQLTYDVSSWGPGSFQLNMHPMPNSGFGGSFRYSASPRQFQIDGGSVAPDKSWTLVPVN